MRESVFSVRMLCKPADKEVKMNKDSAKRAWKKSCVMRHVLVLMDDTLRAILICLRGGGKVGSVTYPRMSFEAPKDVRVEMQLAEVKRWLDCALMQSGIDRKKGYSLTARERGLINAKIGRVNRWTIEQNIDQWKEIVITLAALNLMFFFTRMTLGDTAHRRMVYIEVDKLCLLLGDGCDWLLSADLFDFCKGVLLDGMPSTGMRSEEEFFFRLLAMPCARSKTEKAIFEEKGMAADASAVLAV